MVTKKVISFYSWSEMAEQEFDKAVIAQYEKEHPECGCGGKL